MDKVMDVKELRIDNLLIDAKGRYCKVDSISKEDGFKAPAIKGAITSLPVSPIPLTEELLIKAGFELYDYEVFMKYDTTYLYYRIKPPGKTHWYTLILNPDGINDFCIKYELAEPGVACRISYVHQLQNCYFALIGEELVIKGL